VRGDKLRAELSREIDQEYERASGAIREAEQAAAEAARRELEAAKQREAEREQVAAAAMEAERQRKPLARNGEHHAAHVDRAAAREQALKDYQERMKDAVTELEVGVRDSALGDGTKVLVLRNRAPYPVNFELRCYRSDGVTQKTFSVAMRSGGEQHVGFLQGWCGNFREGEHCEAYVDGERLWEYSIPSPR